MIEAINTTVVYPVGAKKLRKPHTLLVGKKFGVANIIEFVGWNKFHVRVYKCLDDVGQEFYIHESLVKASGDKLGQRKRSAESKLLRMKISDCYVDVLQRCLNAKNKRYHRYGGRGITICAEWLEDKELFVRWALGTGFKPGLTLDRIDNEKGYSPLNCQWLTKSENSKKRKLDTVGSQDVRH